MFVLSIKRTMFAFITTIITAFAVPSIAQQCPPGESCGFVRQDGVTGPDTFESVQEAIDTFLYDRLFIFPGVYQENLIVSSGVVLQSVDGPLLTCIAGDPDLSGIAVSADTQGVEIIGLHITSTLYGISIGSNSEVLIANCVVDNTLDHGITSSWDGTDSITTLRMYNNVVRSSINGSGVYFNPPDECCTRQLAYIVDMHNNAFIGNSRFGMEFRRVDDGVNSGTRDRFSSSYNYILGNGIAAYGGSVNVGSGVTSSNDITSGASGFLSSAAGCGTDVRLSANSNLRDSGRPGVNFRDPDGTRNDIGAYGGPFAAGFFSSPDDGPEVLSVSGPASVRRGETVTIEATGAVR